MACCLTALSHYLNNCWFTISKVHWHSYEYNFTRDRVLWVTFPPITTNMMFFYSVCMVYVIRFVGTTNRGILCCFLVKIYLSIYIYYMSKTYFVIFHISFPGNIARYLGYILPTGQFFYILLIAKLFSKYIEWEREVNAGKITVISKRLWLYRPS